MAAAVTPPSISTKTSGGTRLRSEGSMLLGGIDHHCEQVNALGCLVYLQDAREKQKFLVDTGANLQQKQPLVPLLLPTVSLLTHQPGKFTLCQNSPCWQHGLDLPPPFDMLLWPFVVSSPPSRPSSRMAPEHQIWNTESNTPSIETTGMPPRPWQAVKRKSWVLGPGESPNSPWSLPLHMVPKPDGSLRPCCNYRRLNLATVHDR